MSVLKNMCIYFVAVIFVSVVVVMLMFLRDCFNNAYFWYKNRPITYYMVDDSLGNRVYNLRDMDCDSIKCEFKQPNGKKVEFFGSYKVTEL